MTETRNTPNGKNKTIWDSFLRSEKSEQHQVELTSAITNRLLRYGIGSHDGYEKEIESLDRLYKELPKDKDAEKGFEAMRLFIPCVPGEIFNRYNAIKHEIRSAEIDSLIISACGLSPLGVVAADSGIKVYDTDLSDVAGFKRSVISQNHNYNISTWDILEGKIPNFDGIEGKIGVVAEGLLFYLQDEQRKRFHENMRRLKDKISPDNSVTFIFDCYIAEEHSRKRDTVVNTTHPDWKYFQSLLSNVHSGQKWFPKNRGEVISSLGAEGYENVHVSPISREDNAHTIVVCEYAGRTNNMG